MKFYPLGRVQSLGQDLSGHFPPVLFEIEEKKSLHTLDIIHPLPVMQVHCKAHSRDQCTAKQIKKETIREP